MSAREQVSWIEILLSGIVATQSILPSRTSLHKLAPFTAYSVLLIDTDQRSHPAARMTRRKDGDAAMTEHESSARPGVWSMAVVHQYYRREFELAPRIIRDITSGEHERQQGAAVWFATTLKMMHHHHVTEDELMYPLLHGRVPQPMLDLMELQHEQVAAGVDRVGASLARWNHDLPESSEALADAYDQLLPILVEHLDSEELDVMPLVAEHLSVEEYERQGTSGNQIMDPRTLMMAFGAMIEQASDFEAGVMLSHPPEHVRAAWHAHGAVDYRNLMALLRGDLRPTRRVAPARGAALAEST